MQEPDRHLSRKAAVSKIVSAWRKYKQNQWTDFYKRYDSRCGINIPEQSKKNFDALCQQLKATGPGGGALFFPDEERFVKRWQKEVRPNAISKHASLVFLDNPKLTTLFSTNARLRLGLPIINDHTGARTLLGHNVFSTLGFSDDRATPPFMSAQAAEVIVKIGKMPPEAKRPGLWLSHHFFDLECNRRYRKIFGDTTVSTEFEKQGSKITHIYEYADGSPSKIVTKTFSEGIFSADAGLQTMLDALLYQWILDLRDNFDKKFRDRVLNFANKDDFAKLAADLYHQMHQADVYPELKKTGSLVLNPKYVSVHHPSDEKLSKLFQFEREISKRASEFNVCAVKQLIASGLDVNMPNQYQLAPAIRAIEYGYDKVLFDLLSRGASFSARTSFQKTPLLNLFIIKFIAGNNFLKLLTVLLRGFPDPKMSFIKRIPLLNYHMSNYKDSPLYPLVTSSDEDKLIEIIKCLQKFGLKITSNMPFAVLAYAHKKKTLCRYLLEQGVSVEQLMPKGEEKVKGIHSSSMTLLMMASVRDDRSFATILRQKYSAKLQPKALVHKPILIAEERNTSVAIVICTVNGETHVLMVRAGDNKGKPKGVWKFPGGFVDDNDIDQSGHLDFICAAQREAKEETGLDLRKFSNCTPEVVYTFKKLIDSIYRCNQFILFDLKEQSELPSIWPASDAAAAKFIPKRLIIMETQYGLSSFGNVLILLSNAILFEFMQIEEKILKYTMDEQLLFEIDSTNLFMKSLERGFDLSKINMLIAAGVDLDGKVNHDSPVLQFGRQKNLKKLDFLLSHGADIDRFHFLPGCQALRFTLLSECVSKNDITMVKKLLKRGADPNLSGNFKIPILEAASNGNIPMLQLLLSHGATTQQAIGGQAFLIALEAQRLKFALYLLEYCHIPLNCPYVSGRYLIAEAARCGHPEILFNLLLKGANPEVMVMGEPLLEHLEHLFLATNERENEKGLSSLTFGFFQEFYRVRNPRYREPNAKDLEKCICLIKGHNEKKLALADRWQFFQVERKGASAAAGSCMLFREPRLSF